MDISESITFNRSIGDELKNRLLKGRSFLLLGPRQTGKSTLLEGIFDQLPKERQIRYYLQLPSQRQQLETDPESIVRAVEAMSSKQPVNLYIDEIQKVPQVMDPLQFLIDKRKIVLAASGSSARKLKTLGTNWLPGRIDLEFLYPLTWEEAKLGKNQSRMNEHLLDGALPGILSQTSREERARRLASYTHLYLEEEIRLEAQVRNLPRFSHFLKLAALESGTSPNYSKIAGKVGTSHTTIHEYFQILEDTLIIHRLPPFGISRSKTLRPSKYYFFDLGVRNAASLIGHSEGILQLQIGILFEHFVVLELMARLKGQAKLSFWRTKEGNEVDLVIETGTKRFALEIKATHRPRLDDFEGLELLRKKHAMDACFLVCQIPRAEKFGSCLAMPWHELQERIGF